MVHTVRRSAMAPGVNAPAHLLAFAPDSRRLVVGRADATVAVVDLADVDSVRLVGLLKQPVLDDEEDGGTRCVQPSRSAAPTLRRGLTCPARPWLSLSAPDRTARAGLASLAISADGQWVVVGDLANRLHVYNLDTLQVRATAAPRPYPPGKAPA